MGDEQIYQISVLLNTRKEAIDFKEQMSKSLRYQNVKLKIIQIDK